MNQDQFITKFRDYNLQESECIYQLFISNDIDMQLCINFYELMQQAKSLCYKYNAYVLYEPFDLHCKTNWEFFSIKNKKEVLLQVYYTSLYDLQRIEDNLTALYF